MMSYSHPLCLIGFLLSGFPITRAATNTVTSSTKCFNRTSGPTENQIENTICATKVTTDKDTWTWSQAEDYCINSGGHLITITGYTENTLIKTLIKGKSCWIGLIDAGCPIASDFNWKWIDGYNSAYRFWDTPKQPSNLHSECCTSMWKTNGKWNNYKCYKKLTCFICEYVTKIYPITTTTTSSVTSTRTSSTLTVTSSIPQATAMSPMTSFDGNLVSNGGDIALIILACVFTVVIIGLTFVIFKPRCKQVCFLRTSRNECMDEGTPIAVSNAAYGMPAPKFRNKVEYDIDDQVVLAYQHKLSFNDYSKNLN